MRRHRPTLPAAMVALALTIAALLGGCGRQDAGGAGASGPVPAPPAALPATAPTARAGSGVVVPSAKPAPPPMAPGFEVGALPAAPGAPGPPVPPARLEIPAIGVSTPLDRLGRAADGTLEVPVDFARAGWFSGGTLPGQQGPAVIAGHVDSRSGPAVFYRLRELRTGDTVEVERADGVRLRFAVETLARYRKSALPTAAVFGPVAWPALRLITCGGTFDRDRGSYRDNLVVYARLVGVRR
jgi:hypothetical protein